MNTDRGGMARIFFGAAAIHVLLGAIYTALVLTDTTRLLGISAWVKPLKFALTGAIYLGTLMLFARHLPDSFTEKKGNRAAWIIAVMILGETLLIGMQSARGVTSHFNQKTAFDGIIYSVMGVMIMINTIVFVRMVRHFFKGEQKISGPYLAGIRWGSVLFVIGSLVGGVMSGMNRHTIGIADGGPGLPLVNFSTVAGDLRVAHFLGLHALQILPLFGWVLGRLQKKSGVGAFGSFYAIVFTAVLLQALWGRPFLAI